MRVQAIGISLLLSIGIAQGRLSSETTTQTFSKDADEIGRGCMLPETKSFAFCDVSKSTQERVKDLLGRLTLKEKIGLLGATPGSGNDCALIDAGVPRLGILPYAYLVEVTDGVTSRCLDGHDHKCSTNFASAAMLAASFNRTLWYTKGTVIASEIRAMYHTKSKRQPMFDTYIGLHGYGPNVNLMRDPRWGRNQEVPSEDPFLSGEYAKYYTQGMQQKDEKGYLKMHASIKHYAAYSVEDGRSGFNGIIDTFNIHDSYLPAFEKGIKEGGSGGAMCSYASINGVPSCANAWLFDKARNDWNQTNFLITTDCGALNNMFNPGGNGFAKDVIEAITATIKSGTDLEMGDHYYQQNGNLQRAIEELHMASESNVNAALGRVLHHRFELGMFDPLERQEFAQGDHVATINSTKHQAINLEAAIQGLVLLQNPNRLLPLEFGTSIAVVGPHAMSREGLFEKYRGDFVCTNNKFDCVPSIGEQIVRYNFAGKTLIVPVSMHNPTNNEIDQAVQAAKASNVTIACVGLDLSFETEGLDRKDLQLPKPQRDLIDKLIVSTPNLIVVLINGGAIAVENIIPTNASIVEAFYPAAIGGEVLTRTLFGMENRWGLLPFSVYANTFVDELEMNDMSFTKPPGRTYRYYTGTSTLFPFGFGLSYTSFALNDCALTTGLHNEISVSCGIQNVGAVVGDTIVLLFHRVKDAHVQHPVPLKSLVDFSRHTLLPGQEYTVKFNVSREQMSLVNELGNRIFYKEFTHEFLVSTHNQVSWSTDYSPNTLNILDEGSID